MYCDGPVNQGIVTHEDERQPVHESKHRYGRQESIIDWWAIYEEIKLKKEEKLRGRRPLNTGGAKLGEVRWLKAMCVAAKRAGAVTCIIVKFNSKCLI